MNRRDLSRWNRAGLSRVRYVDGNAVTFLDTLRHALIARLGDPESGDPDRWRDLVDLFPAGDDERQQLLAQYHGPRRDLGWEILRAFARACHVLTEHLDAYANEGFLTTASQWDNVRRLVSMLDHAPAPPASAATVLALRAKEGARGTVAKGFQVQHVPAEGGAPVIFETLEDVTVDAALNRLRIADWNHSAHDSETAVWIAPARADVAAGQIALIEHPEADEAEAVLIRRVDPATGVMTLDDLQSGAWRKWPRATARLSVVPRFAGRPWLNGPGKVIVGRAEEPAGTAGHGLAPGEVVAWSQGGGWRFARVLDADRRGLAFTPGSEPPAGAELWQAGRIEGGDGGLLLPAGARAAAKPSAGGFIAFDVTDAAWTTLESAEPSEYPTGTYRRLIDEDVKEIYLAARELTAVGKVMPSAAGTLQFDDDAELQTGAWAVAGEHPAGTVAGDDLEYRAVKIERVNRHSTGVAVTLAPKPEQGLERLYARFEHALAASGHDRNETAVAGSKLELDPLPETLLPGTAILLEDATGEKPAFFTRVAAILEQPPGIEIEPPLPEDADFMLGDTVIRANLARAGHGERKPAKILGSGDATRGGQSLVLEITDVSFVADPAQPSGVRPDIEVEVADRTWQQVPSLRDSEPTDPHFTARVTEQGTLRFTFGDGRHGRRLPTGANNVRIAYRAGSGPAGNLDPGSLSQPVKPHPLVAAVEQPLAAAGGNAMEGARSLRQNAPASVLTMDRAVSLTDFTHLATRQSSVWQARAFARPTGDRWQANVEVVVVPAGGTALDGLAKSLSDTLRRHALPGVAVTVTRFVPKPLHLSVETRIKTAEYQPREVLARVRSALEETFSLRQRRLGEDLYLSEVIKVVEGVAGVDSSVCQLGVPAADGSVDYDLKRQRLTADERAVIYLDSARSSLILSLLEPSP